MQIGSTTSSDLNNFSAMKTGISIGTDTQTKNFQKQIENAQKKLQELAENDQLSIEGKMEKRQEINQQINDLKKQLRQHQIELRKEKQQSKGSSTDDILGAQQKEKSTTKNYKGTGMSQAGMMAMISGDTAMKQAQVQEHVATTMNGRAGVLESEIKMDKGRGASTEAKEAELADIQEKALKVTRSSMEALADANKEMQEADKANETEESTDITENSNTAKTQAVDDTEMEKKRAASASDGSKDIVTAESSDYLGFKSVDIRL
ncbi:MAG: FlxA-like family protein [Velocimicrobium sp.]